jgi:glycosyltransferase involved in cell wall biosynthesis
MHVLWKFNERACEKPECLRCTLIGKRPPQLWRYTNLLPRMSKHVDQFVSPSRFTANMHAERGFPKAIDHLPYFIDRVDSDWQAPGPRPQERPYFLFVGRLEAIKGLQLLIKAWEKVQDYDLLVVGAGNYSEPLKALAGANPRIKFLGPKPQRELGRLYSVRAFRRLHRPVDHLRDVRHHHHRILRPQGPGHRPQSGGLAGSGSG